MKKVLKNVQCFILLLISIASRSHFMIYTFFVFFV